MLEEEKISRIKVLLKSHPKGLTITDIAAKLMMNRNSAAKYLEILTISGQVESKTYGMARVFFLAHRLPISALVSIASDLVVTLDEKYRILFVNKGFCDLFSVQNEAIAGSHIIDIFKTGVGCDVLPGIFSDVIADPEKVHEARIKRDSGEIFFKIKSMKTVFDDGTRGITIIMEDVTREKRDKIELEAKESRYRGIVEDQIDYVIRFLPDGTLSFANTSYSHFLKKRAEELVGTLFSDPFQHQDREVFDHCLGTLTREHPVAAFECRITPPAGPARWIAWTLRVMYDGEKEPFEYQAVGHDITEKKEAAERIHQQITQMEFFSQKLQQFIELQPGADIYRVIATGLSEILPGSAISVSCYDPGTTILTVKAVFPAEDRDLFSRSLGRDIIGLQVRTGDTAPPAGFLTGRIYHTRKNLYDILFRQVPEETCTSIEDALNYGEFYSIGMIWQGALLGNVTLALKKGQQLENGALAETYVQAASIALQRSRAETALAESENLYRTVIKNMQDVFYRADMEGNIIMGSPSWAKMFGYSSPDEAIGMNIARDFYLDPEKRKEFLNALVSAGSVTDYEIVLKKKDGTPVHVSANSHLYYDKDGTLLGVEGIFRDISDRHAADEKIRRHIAEMEFLSRKLLDFITMKPSENIYEKIAADFRDMIPGSRVVVNSFDTKTGIVTVQGAMMSARERDILTRFLGRLPVGSRFPVSEPGLASFRTGQVHKAPSSLYEVLFKSIPETACRQIEPELGIGDIYGIGFVRNGEVLGNATIFLQPGDDGINLPLVEMYAREASIALQRYLAEEARRKSDEIFYHTAQNSPFPIALIGPDGTYRYINGTFTRVFGYTLDDFNTGKEWLRLAFPDPIARKKVVEVWKSDQAQSRTGWSISRTYPVHCKDSTIKEIIFRPVPLSDGNYCIVYEDITERRRADQTQRLLSSIIASTSDAVIGKDVKGMIISWNKAAERLYGYPAEEVIGHHISLIIPPERKDEMEKIFRQIEEGASVSTLETQRLRKDGRVINVSVTISPIADEAGNVIGASIIARDISPMKAEEDLRGHEEHYRSLVEDISVGMYRSTGDPAGHFVWGNSSLVKILGYPSFEHLKGVEIADIFVESEGRKKLLAELRKEGFVRNREIALKRADGETISVRVTALARFGTGGGLSCINGIVEDITGQRRAEQKAQIVNKRMQDILTFIRDPIVIVDDKNTVVAWNAAMEQLTGVEKTAVLGRSDFDRFLPFHDPSRPSLFTFLDAPDASLEWYYPGAFREGSTIVSQLGSPLPREGTSVLFTVRVSPLSDPHGARIGAVQIIQSATTDDKNRTSLPPLDPLNPVPEEMPALLFGESDRPGNQGNTPL